MLQLGALDFSVDGLRLGGGKDRSRLGNVLTGGNACALSVLGELQGFGIIADLAIQQMLLGIDDAQGEVTLGKLRLQAQAGGLHVRCRRLGIGLRGADTVADSSPEVDFPAEIE